MRQMFAGLVVLVTACSDGAWPPEPFQFADSTKTVEAVTVGKIYLYPFTKVMAVGQSFRLDVVVRDSRGRAIADPEIVFRAIDETIATVDSGGWVKAQAIGETIITVRSGGKKARATIMVSRLPIKEETESGAGDWDY